MNMIRRRLNLEEDDTDVDDRESNGLDRDAVTGRFVQGNPGGPGNPMGKQLSRLRTALIRAVDEDDLDQVIRALVRQAKGGDVASAKVLLERLFGKPWQQISLTGDDWRNPDPSEVFL